MSCRECNTSALAAASGWIRRYVYRHVACRMFFK